MQWIRDELKFIKTAKETEEVVKNRDPNSRVIVVPAFTAVSYTHLTLPTKA